MFKYKGETLVFAFRKLSLLAINDAPFNYYIRIKGWEKTLGEHTCVKLAHSSMSLSLNKFFHFVFETIIHCVLGFK